MVESEIDVEPAPLAGAANERPEPTLERSFADIERDIEALYQQAAPHREAPAESFGVTSSDAEQEKKDAAAEIEFSDAGSASPW
jgi:hypothetical protein